MFKGNNVLKLNEATVIAALEEYINARIISGSDEVKVTSVTLDSSTGYNGRRFSVTTSAQAETAKP